ncbi:MAG: hypothetical protein Q8L52_01735 [bacterium]|nr:hypothetical protein [bacterium]
MLRSKWWFTEPLMFSEPGCAIFMHPPMGRKYRKWQFGHSVSDPVGHSSGNLHVPDTNVYKRNVERQLYEPELHRFCCNL